MTTWQTYKLGDLIDVQNGFAFKSNDLQNTGTPVIKIKNIQPPNISLKETDYYPHELTSKMEQFLVKQKDILISMTGSHVSQISSAVGKVGRYGFEKPALLNQRVGKLFSKDLNKLDNDFLFYLVSRPEIQFELATNAGGSANQANISPQNIKDLEVEVPEVEAQQEIAKILTALDNKLELNRRMNHTLEQMAQTLFQQYFVDGIDADNLPDGWRKATFINELEAARGLSYKGSGLCNKGEGVPMHNLNSIYEGGGYKYEGIKFYNGESKERHLIKPWDIIVSNTEQGHKYLLIGYPSIIPSSFGEIGIFTQHLYRVRPKTNSYLTPQFIYYLLLSPSIREQIIACTNGTTVNMLAMDGLEKPQFLMPPKAKIQEFSNHIIPIWKKKESLQVENEKLSQIRDTLLPKLMSGEIDVMQTQPAGAYEEVLS